MNTIETAKTTSVPRVLGITATSLVVCGFLFSAFTKMTLADANASAVPQMRTDVNDLQKRTNHLDDVVTNLQDRRTEDSESMRGMRQEIIGRLDRIENKLDQKADKEPVRGFTR